MARTIRDDIDDFPCTRTEIVINNARVGVSVYHYYLPRAYEEAIEYAKQNNLVVATMPKLLDLLVQAAWEEDIHRHAYTSATEEAIGVTAAGTSVYLTGHGPVLPLSASPDRIHRGYELGGVDDRVALTEQEIKTALQGKTPDGRNVQLYESFRDFCDAAEANSLPNEYIVVTNFEREKNIGFANGRIDTWEQDERMIIRTGGSSRAERFFNKLREQTTRYTSTSLAPYGKPNEPCGSLVGISNRGFTMFSYRSYLEDIERDFGHFVALQPKKSQ